MVEKVDVVSIVSGGLDSVTMAYLWKSKGLKQSILSFNYGQRHSKELFYAERQARLLNVPHQIINLADVKKLFSNSALTSDIEVPEGHYAEDNMAVTVVPNRNAIMLTIAASYASSIGASAVATAVHTGDHYQYPDCRLEFLLALQKMWCVSMGTTDVPNILSPYLDWSKAQIAEQAGDLGVPIEQTWSCYKGGEQHCGCCGTCVERIEALHLAGVNDPTVYTDPNFWVQAILDRNKKLS